MSRDTRNVVADIDALPTADGDDLGRLQELIDEYFASPAAAGHIDVWFRLYERFPDEHGQGVFWNILQVGGGGGGGRVPNEKSLGQGVAG